MCRWQIFVQCFCWISCFLKAFLQSCMSPPPVMYIETKQAPCVLTAQVPTLNVPVNMLLIKLLFNTCIYILIGSFFYILIAAKSPFIPLCQCENYWSWKVCSNIFLLIICINFYPPYCNTWVVSLLQSNAYYSNSCTVFRGCNNSHSCLHSPGSHKRGEMVVLPALLLWWMYLPKVYVNWSKENESRFWLRAKKFMVLFSPLHCCYKNAC